MRLESQVRAFDKNAVRRLGSFLSGTAGFSTPEEVSTDHGRKREMTSATLSGVRPPARMRGGRAERSKVARVWERVSQSVGVPVPPPV